MDDLKIFVGGLSFSTTEEKLLEKISEFGKVTSIRIPINRETGKSSGFGFVTLSSVSEVEKVIENLNNKEFDGRYIGVKHYIAKEGR